MATLEYENIKLKKEDSVHVTNACDQLQLITEGNVGSTSSLQSTSYQTFCLEGDLEQASHSTLQKKNELKKRALLVSTTYSYPKVSEGIQGNKMHQEDEAGYAYATTDSVAPKRKPKSHSTSQLPSGTTTLRAITDLPLPLPPTLVQGTIQTLPTLRESSVIQVSEATKKIHDQPLTSKQENQLSTATQPTLMEAPSATGRVKPLIMKMLPLYFCMDDGKVYADRNAASIPTHHLIEVIMDADIKNDDLCSAKPQNHATTKSTNDLLMRSNPVYETVPQRKPAATVTYNSTPSLNLIQPVTLSERNESPSFSQLSLPYPSKQEPHTEDLEKQSKLYDTPAASSTPTALDSTSTVGASEIIEAVDEQTTAAASVEQLISSNRDRDSKDNDGVHEIESPSHNEIEPTDSIKSPDRVPAETKTEQSLESGVTGLQPMRRYSYGNWRDVVHYGEYPHEAHSYFYFTIVAAIVVGVCLDFVVLLAVFVPALWFANKASHSKHAGDLSDLKKYARRALVLNIVGGIAHVVFIIIVILAFFLAVLLSVVL